jgi:DeoR/GlpR family transcriptional regulator of sugar metabolism
MVSAQRKSYILKTAQADGFVSIPKTAEKFGVSIETIRRDINQLCALHQLKKVHGGAAPIKTPVRKDPRFMTRIHQNQQGKIAISEEAVKMIRNGDVVTMDGGATTAVLATCIRGVQNVTFVVNSLPIATTLLEKLETGEITGKVIMIGGELDVKSQAASDVLAATTVDKYHFDLAFISCSSLSATSVSNSSLSGALVRKLMDHASVSVLIADSDKIGKNSIYEFAKPTDFDRIIIDGQVPCPPELERVLSESDTLLTIV